jgi:hypothetical protein
MKEGKFNNFRALAYLFAPDESTSSETKILLYSFGELLNLRSFVDIHILNFTNTTIKDKECLVCTLKLSM